MDAKPGSPFGWGASPGQVVDAVDLKTLQREFFHVPLAVIGVQVGVISSTGEVCHLALDQWLSVTSRGCGVNY